jgi:hypothetical protein
MLDPTSNFAKCVVSTGYNAAATSVVLSTGDGAKLPQPSTAGAFNLVWWDSTTYGDPADDPNVEIVRCTGRSTDTLTVSRAQEGTSASTKNTSGKTYKMILAVTKKMMDDIGALGTLIENEVVDGSGTSWTLANTPITGSVKLYAGTRLIPGGNDYSISGANITTNSSYPLGALIADYRK